MVKYIVKSPVKIDANRRGNGDDVGSYDLQNLDADAREDLVAAVNEEMAELGNGGLAQWIHPEHLKALVTNIVVTVNGIGAETIVEAVRELTPKEQQEIMDYISGQFSDGWGEGFEQREFSSYNDTFTDEWEDEEEEEDEDGDLVKVPVMREEEVTDKVELCAHFWHHYDFKMEIEKVA